jgi:isopenicillin-N N-acyltransferase-like protein
VSLARHVSGEATPRDRGHAFGRAQAAAIDNTIRVYRRMLEGVDLCAAGEEVAPLLGPAHVDELEGMAAGAGQDVRDLLAVNARTELLAGAECSVVGRAGGELAQTWDWHPDLVPSRVVWRVEGAFTTVTEAGLLAKLGVNRHGVACALNLIEQAGGLGGVPVHVLLRRVLEQAEDGPHALALLTGAHATASSAVTIATADDLFTAELSPDGPTVIRPDADGWLVHTNHACARPPRTDQAGSQERRARLAELVRAGVPPHEALADHHAVEQPICRHDDPSVAWPDRVATLLAIRVDPAARTLEVSDGPPCGAPYLRIFSPQNDAIELPL